MATQRIPVPMLGGVNLLADPAAIRDDEVTEARNLFPNKSGVVGMRPAMQFKELLTTKPIDLDSIQLGKTLAVGCRDQGNTGTPYPVRLYFPSFGGEWFIFFVDADTGRLYGQFGPHTTPTDPIPLGTYQNAPSLIEFNGYLLIIPGNSEAPVVVVTKSTDEPGYTLSTTPVFTDGQDIRPVVACASQKRMWYANLGEGYESSIVVSDTFDHSLIGPDILTGGSRAFTIDAANGEAITAIADLALHDSGTPAQTVVGVWTASKFFVITGAPQLTTETPASDGIFGDMNLIQFNIPAGCPSPMTIVRTPYGVMWAGTDDVWILSAGNVPQRVGTKIRSVLQDAPSVGRARWHAAFGEGAYRLAICSSEWTGKFNACDQQWWLAMHTGAPGNVDQASWWGPQIYSPHTAKSPGVYYMTKDTRPKSDGTLVALQEFYHEDFGGWTEGGVTYWTFENFVLCSLDAALGFDCNAPLVTNVNRQPSTAYFQGDIAWPIISLQFAIYNSTKLRTSPWYVYDAGTTDSTPTKDMDWTGANNLNDGGVGWYRAIILRGIPIRYAHRGSIPCLLTTKEHTLGDVITDKLMDGIELGYRSTDTLKLATYLLPSSVTQLTRVYGAQTADYDEIDVTNQLVHGFRKFKSVLISPKDANGNPIRPVGKTIRATLRVAQPDAYLIPDTTLSFLTIDTDGISTLKQTVLIPGGAYSVMELLTVLIPLMQAELPATLGDITSSLDLAVDEIDVTHIGLINGNNDNDHGWVPFPLDPIWIGVGDTDTITAADVVANRRIASILGFSDPGGDYYRKDVVLYGDTCIPSYPAPTFIWPSFVLRARQFGRRANS